MRFPLLPLSALALLAWGLRICWKESGRAGRTGPAPLQYRVVACTLGMAWGWLMANFAYAPDPSMRVVGFPLPVCLWVNRAGFWTDQAPTLTLPCLLLDLLLFAFLAERFLALFWERFQATRTRRRG